MFVSDELQVGVLHVLQLLLQLHFLICKLLVFFFQGGKFFYLPLDQLLFFFLTAFSGLFRGVDTFSTFWTRFPLPGGGLAVVQLEFLESCRTVVARFSIGHLDVLQSIRLEGSMTETEVAGFRAG